MKKLIIILMMITLGCAKDKPEPVGMEFRTIRNLPIIETTINGKKGKFLIDTGATLSIIDSNLKDEYGFNTYDLYPDEQNGVSGIGGTQYIQHTQNIVVKYKGQLMYLDLYAMDIKNIRKSIGVVGIIGSDYLNSNKLKVDFNAKVINVIDYGSK